MGQLADNGDGQRGPRILVVEDDPDVQRVMVRALAREYQIETADDGAVSRVIAPGGLADQLLANDGLIERLLREDGVADKLMAEGGLLDTLTAEDGPLLKLADVADTINRLAPGLEALAPTIDALHEAVITLSQVVNPLSNIAGRIPLPRAWRRPATGSWSTRGRWTG